MQQVVRTAMLVPEDFSKEDIEALDAVISMEDGIQVYNYNLVDRVRHTYKPYATKGDLIQFFKIWLREGFRHPGIYFRTMIGTNGGFFGTKYTLYIYKNFTDGQDFNIYHITELADARNLFVHIYNSLAEVPFIKILYMQFIYSWIIPCYMAWKLFKERSVEIAISSIPIWLSIATFYFSPTVNSRYALHIILLTPIMLGINKMYFKVLPLSRTFLI